MSTVKKKEPSYIKLFISFFWMGLTAFGGLAMFSHLRRYIVEKQKWLDATTFDSGFALCQVIPGSIIMQLAAYIGLKLKGTRGSIVCFIGFGLPAFLIMLLLSIMYKHSRNLTGVEVILSGIRVIIVAIVANAAFSFGRKNLRNFTDWIIAFVAAALFLTKLHPAIVLISAGFLGLLLTKKNILLPEKSVGSKTFIFFLLALALLLTCMVVLFILSKEYFTLASAMLRVDLFSFGGGLASMPIMYHELVDLFGWVDQRTFMDGAILGQVTPGSIIIAAAFFGYMHLGFTGSLLATLAVFIPSYLVLMGLIPFFDKLMTYPQFNKVINGILCSFVGLLVIVTYRFSIGISWSLINIFLAVAAFVLLLRKVDVIWVILGGVLVTILIHFI